MAANYQKTLRGRISKANGAYFEEILIRTCEMYRAKGMAKIEKTPEPMRPISAPDKSGSFRAVFTRHAQPDFKGVLYGGTELCFEAKHTDSDRMEHKRVTEEQLADLNEHQKFGAVAFVLLSFGMEKFYRVPVGVWNNMKEKYGRLYITPEDIREYAVDCVNGYVDFLEMYKEAAE